MWSKILILKVIAEFRIKNQVPLSCMAVIAGRIISKASNRWVAIEHWNGFIGSFPLNQTERREKMRRNIRRLTTVFFTVAFVIVISALTPINAAEKYPSKPITIIMPWSGGGFKNVLLRTLQPLLEKELGVPIVIVEKPGSGGAVGWGTLQVAKPDGYTLAPASKSIFGAHWVTKGQVDYRNFEPIVTLAYDYFSITVNAESPWKTFDDFLKYVKANPGKVRAGSSGTGGIWHICLLAFNKAAGTEIVHVPYAGGGKAVVAVVGKHIESTIVTPGDMMAVLPTGKLRILAIGGPVRNPFYPDVPTVKERGIDLVMGNWSGMVAPKGTPKERIQVIDKAFANALKDPKYNEFLKKNRVTNDYAGAEETRKYYFQEAETMLNFLKTVQKKGK